MEELLFAYQKNNVPPHLKRCGLIGTCFLDARERPHLKRCGFQRSRHYKLIKLTFAPCVEEKLIAAKYFIFCSSQTSIKDEVAVPSITTAKTPFLEFKMLFVTSLIPTFLMTSRFSSKSKPLFVPLILSKMFLNFSLTSEGENFEANSSGTLSFALSTS